MNTLFKVYSKLCVLFYRVKYIIYFNIFLNVLFINFLHYKVWNVLNTKLASLLNFSIKLNGCVIIKLIQWLNTNLELLGVNSANYNFITKLFDCYYEDCPIHELKYTKDLFSKEFGIEFDDYFELDNTYSIKSGSVAQIYKASIKNNNNNNNNNNINVAIKVVHPEIEYQLICPSLLVKLYTYLVSNFKCFNKYDIIIDLNSFFCNLEKQINMENEYKNNEYFYNTYKNNNIIIIPKPLMKSKNFLIMEFIDGEQIEQLNISDYKKQILVGFIAIFMKDTFVNGKYIHCDLHQANWKIYKQINNSTTISNTEDVDVNVNVNVNYKIVIYDFGYVIENSANNTFKNLAFYLDTNDINGLGNLLYNNIKNIDTSNNYKEDFMERFKNHDNMSSHTTTDKLLLASVNMCYINGYKLNNNLLDYFVSIILLNKYFKKYLFLNDESSKEMLYKHIYNKSMFYISICEKYNVFHEIKNNLYDTYIKNSKFSVKLTYRNNYLNSLKKTNYDISLAHNTSSIDI